MKDEKGECKIKNVKCKIGEAQVMRVRNVMLLKYKGVTGVVTVLKC